MDFSELRQIGEELIALGSQQVNSEEESTEQKITPSSSADDEESSFAVLFDKSNNEINSANASNNYSSFNFSSSYRNVEPSIASTSYSSAIDDPLLASATNYNTNHQHTYFNASDLLNINSSYNHQLGSSSGLGLAGGFHSPPVMEDIMEEENEAIAENKHDYLDDDPVLYFHDPKDSSNNTMSMMKDGQVSQMIQQHLDCWNFEDGTNHDCSEWNSTSMNSTADNEFHYGRIKQADQRENFDTSSLYFSTCGSEYASSMQNLDTQQFFPNPQQPLVSITSGGTGGAGVVTGSSSSSSLKLSTEKRFQPSKHRVARKELRSLSVKLEKAKKKKQRQQEQHLQMTNLPLDIKSSTISTCKRPNSTSVSSASSYSAQSTSQHSSAQSSLQKSSDKSIHIPTTTTILANQNHASQPLCAGELLQISEMTETTRLIYTAFAQTKIVYYDANDDKRAKRSSVPDGFSGFACKHCEGKSKCAEISQSQSSSRKKPKFARCGRYFPSNIKTFADRSKTLNALVKHLIKCPLVPLETRNNLILFEQCHDQETKMKRMLNASYTQKDIFKTMWNRLHPGDEQE